MATKGRSDEVGRAIDSLLAQTSSTFELILADQNIDDRLVPYVDHARNRGMNINHIRLKTADQSLARNTGIEYAVGDYVAFPDDDCWYMSDSIENALKGFEATGADCLIGRWYERDDEKMAFHTVRREAARSFRSVGPSMITQFYKKQIIKKAGGFDSRFGLGRWYGGSEDTDLFLSVIAAGARTVYYPALIIRHRYPHLAATGGQDLAMVRCRARGIGAIYAKHRLSVYVVLRGFLGPIIPPLLTLNTADILPGAYTALGRIEGYSRWKLRE